MTKADKLINEKCKNYIQKYAKQNKALRELTEKIKDKNSLEIKVIKKKFIEEIVKKKGTV